MASQQERRGMINGNAKAEVDEGPCGPKNPCGKYFWTPFNVVTAVVMLYSMVPFIFGIYEFITGNRITYLNGYLWIAVAGVCLAGGSFIVLVICASQGLPVQRTEKPQMHQYWPSIHVTTSALVVSVLYVAVIAGYRHILPQAQFDQLNTISDATAEGANGPATVSGAFAKWQQILVIFGLPWIAPIGMWVGHVMAECAPLLGYNMSRGSAGAASRTGGV